MFRGSSAIRMDNSLFGGKIYRVVFCSSLLAFLYFVIAVEFPDDI